MKRCFIFSLVLLLLYGCVYADETLTISEHMRGHCSNAVKTFYNINLPDDQSFSAVFNEKGEQQTDIWICNVQDVKTTFSFSFDTNGRLLRVSRIPHTNDPYVSEPDPTLTISTLSEAIVAHLAHLDTLPSDDAPFSNVKIQRVFPQWQTGNTFVYEIICGPGDKAYDHSIIDLYYNRTADVITHVTFLYLD